MALADIMRSIDKELVDPIVVIASDGPLVERIRPHAEVHVIPLASEITKTSKDSLGASSLMRVGQLWTATRYILRLARFIRRRRVEIVHCNSLKADILGGFAGRLARREVVWHVRDRIEDDYLPSKVVKLFRRLARAVPTYVVANSQATLDTLHLQGRRGSQVVFSGVDLSRFPAENLQHSGPLQPSAPKIGIVGRISRWKGQHIFLRAAAIVHRSFPTAHFQIIGSALFDEKEYEAEVRALTTTLALASRVEFTGFRTDVNELILGLDILVHASITGEPFGQVIVQGMAAGKPVIATNGGGVPEIVLHGRTGFLVNMGDAEAMGEAIIQLLSNPYLGYQMGKAARQRVEQIFTIQQTVRDLQILYGRLRR